MRYLCGKCGVSALFPIVCTVTIKYKLQDAFYVRLWTLHCLYFNMQYAYNHKSKRHNEEVLDSLGAVQVDLTKTKLLIIILGGSFSPI